MVYISDTLGTESASLSVHQAIPWNSENITPYNIDDGIFIRLKYNRKNKFVPFVKRLNYTCII